MKNIADNIPAIIKEAAKSILGVVSLVVLLLSLLAFAFFKDSSDFVKLLIFIPILCSFSGFILTIICKAHAVKPTENNSGSKENDFLPWGTTQIAARHRTSYGKFSAEPGLTLEDRTRNSLRKRLENDFYISGVRKGQFGKSRIEDRHYQLPGGEHLKLKPSYYLTYWGWRGVFDLLPHLVEYWAKMTSEEIRGRFRGKRWIEVHLQGYNSMMPTTTFRKAATVRHTVRAAEILLLLNRDLNITSQVAWEIVSEAHLLTSDGGWKEFHTCESPVSLWASIYIYHFLQSLRCLKLHINMPHERNSFIKQVTPLIQNTEAFLENHWRVHRWKFCDIPWQVTAPPVFVEYAPFSQNTQFLADVYEAFTNLLLPSGRLKEPDVGMQYDAPEYNLSIRIAYALTRSEPFIRQGDERARRLIRWLLETYSEDHSLKASDITFLNELARTESAQRLDRK